MPEGGLYALPPCIEAVAFDQVTVNVSVLSDPLVYGRRKFLNVLIVFEDGYFYSCRMRDDAWQSLEEFVVFQHYDVTPES